MSDIVTAVLLRAADDIESQQITGLFQAGPQTWVAAHAAARDMVTSPLIEHLRRHLGIDQVQFWRASREDAVATIRAAAGHPPLTLAELQNADAHKRMDDARYRLAAALGYGGLEHSYTLEHLCDDVRSQLAQKDHQIEALQKQSAP